LADRPGSQATPGLLDTAVEGPVCESTDSFGRHLLPPLRRGDLVAIGQAGAYGASFTSRYNGRPPPAEILLRPDGTLAPGERPPVTRQPVSRPSGHEGVTP
ncbi:MAG: diaminopimelate decarboxylase, partial [Actinobacteria bacterium]|nr:diaminopimelate decarboxylase [Actinomycetota bacterium]